MITGTFSNDYGWDQIDWDKIDIQAAAQETREHFENMKAEIDELKAKVKKLESTIIEISLAELKNRIKTQLGDPNDWYLSSGLADYLEAGKALLDKGFTIEETYNILEKCFNAADLLFE